MVRYIFLALALTFALGADGQSVCVDSLDTDYVVRLLTGDRWRTTDTVKLQRAELNADVLRLTFNEHAQTLLLTEERLNAATDSLRARMSRPDLKVSFVTDNGSLRKYLPKRYKRPKSDTAPLVRRNTSGSLDNRTFALWNSHGRYYEQSLSRWEWQRARLFTTVEDLLSTSFVLPFLAPMLENAGANVLLPRERDIQHNVVVVDNTSEGFTVKGNISPCAVTTGYKHLPILRGNDNPFVMGDAYTYEMTVSDTIIYKGMVAQTGDYGVHVCFGMDEHNAKSVCYTVASGVWETTYTVNQRRGGSMWIYLGTHRFRSGEPWTIKVTADGRVSADAVRLGGGMGVVERRGSTSGMPRYMECARYYLQADGFNADIYSLSNGQNDYNDDINARGEWVNALVGEKNIAVDAAIALHTDAGIAQADTTIGTLTIVSTANKAPYVDGSSRFISHSLAHVIESSVVNDIRAKWDSRWSERGIWDKRYSESRRANVPSVLIELLSHQNLNDMRYALHPQFRFDVSRAIYKALLRFFEGDDAVVQPMPVEAFGIEQLADDTLRLSWSAAPDPLEPTAMPTAYDIYADGMLLLSTADTSVLVHQRADGVLRSYHVVAKNSGGVSFPSQMLGARLKSGAPRAVVVDADMRVASPDVVKTETFAGVLRSSDNGVAWGRELLYCGEQYDYDPGSPWLDDDAPGWGASYADGERDIIVGNRSLDASVYVDSLYLNDGCSTVSMSKEFFERCRPLQTDRLYISLGNERTTWYGDSRPKYAVYTADFISAIDTIAQTNIPITIAGNYVTSELTNDTVARWAAQRLGVRHMSHKASRTRRASSVDALVPAIGEATTIERYPDTNASAAVRYRNITIYGYDAPPADAKSTVVRW